MAAIPAAVLEAGQRKKKPDSHISADLDLPHSGHVLYLGQIKVYTTASHRADTICHILDRLRTEMEICCPWAGPTNLGFMLLRTEY